MPDTIVVQSEFASVRVTLDQTGNGPRLRMEDTDTSSVIVLDPLILVALSSAPALDVQAFAERYLVPSPGHGEVGPRGGEAQDEGP